MWLLVSAEVEYWSMASTTIKIFWMCKLLIKIGYLFDQPSKLWCNNQSTLHIRENHLLHERTKHIEVDSLCERCFT